MISTANILGARVAPVEVRPNGERAAAAGQYAGVNKAVKGTTLDGDSIVFKHNSEAGGVLSNLLPQNYGRQLDVREMVASHIFHDEFKLPSVTYQEGFYQDPAGQRHDGVVCALVPGMTTLAQSGVESIKNPDQAVQENVLKGWMGAWDIVVNGSNLFIDGNGNSIGGDYGNSLQKGISDLGLPRANLEIMNAYARRDNVEPIVSQIRSLSDDDISSMVNRVGQTWVHDWNDQQASPIIETLQHNRDLLLKSNPFEKFYEGDHPLLKLPASKPVKFIKPALLQWPRLHQKISSARSGSERLLGGGENKS